MAAPISYNDDIVANSIEAAFDRLEKAQRAVLRLALRLDEGAVRTDYPGLCLDTHIRRVVGEMHTARYEADAALCTLMKSEAYQPRPTQSAQCLEMQARAMRNERRVPRSVPDARLPATVSPGALA